MPLGLPVVPDVKMSLPQSPAGAAQVGSMVAGVLGQILDQQQLDRQIAEPPGGGAVGDNAPRAGQRQAVAQFVVAEMRVERGLAGARQDQAVARPDRRQPIAQEGRDRHPGATAGLAQLPRDAGSLRHQRGERAGLVAVADRRPIAMAGGEDGEVVPPGDHGHAAKPADLTRLGDTFIVFRRRCKRRKSPVRCPFAVVPDDALAASCGRPWEDA